MHANNKKIFCKLLTTAILHGEAGNEISLVDTTREKAVEVLYSPLFSPKPITHFCGDGPENWVSSVFRETIL